MKGTGFKHFAHVYVHVPSFMYIGVHMFLLIFARVYTYYCIVCISYFQPKIKV